MQNAITLAQHALNTSSAIMTATQQDCIHPLHAPAKAVIMIMVHLLSALNAHRHAKLVRMEPIALPVEQVIIGSLVMESVYARRDLFKGLELSALSVLILA